jgi:hypothetical protein
VKQRDQRPSALGLKRVESGVRLPSLRLLIAIAREL